MSFPFRIFLTMILPLAAMTLISCDEFLPEYAIGFYNRTGTDIQDAGASWHADGHTYHESKIFLSAGAEAASHEQPRPIPAQATVTWKTSDGKTHEKVVEVARLIADPPKFSGTIYFEFTPDGGLKVVPLTYAEERQAAERGESALRGSR